MRYTIYPLRYEYFLKGFCSSGLIISINLRTTEDRERYDARYERFELPHYLIMSIAETAYYLIRNIQNNDTKNDKFSEKFDSIILILWEQFLLLLDPDKSPWQGRDKTTTLVKYCADTQKIPDLVVWQWITPKTNRTHYTVLQLIQLLRENIWLSTIHLTVIRHELFWP